MKKYVICLCCLLLLTLLTKARNTQAAESPDAAEGFAKMQEMAERGNADAQYLIGMFYGSGGTLTGPPDTYKAAEWFYKTAEQRYSQAQYMLGFAHLAGASVIRDKQ